MRNQRLHFLFALLFFYSKLIAADFTWTGNAGDHNWATANNWSPASVPSNSDVAQFVGKTDSIFFSAHAAVANLKILKDGIIPAYIVFKSLGNYTLTVSTLTAAAAVIVESSCQFSLSSDAAGDYMTLDIGTTTAATAGEMSGTMTIFGYNRTSRTDGGGLLKISSGQFNVNDWLNYFGGDNPVLTGTGRLYIQSGASFYLQRDNYALPNIEYSTTANLHVAAKTLGTIGTTSFGHIIINSPSMNANQNLGMVSVQNTAVFVQGSLTINNINGQNLKLGEAIWSLQVAGTTDIYDGTVAFSNHTTTSFSTPYIYVTLQGKLTIHSGSTLDLQVNTGEISLILQNDLTVAIGGTLKATNAQPTYPANQTNSKVTFGNTAATQTWIANGSLGTQLYNFLIDKSAGKVILGSNVVAPNNFVFNNGNLEIGNYSLTATDIILGVGSFSASRHFIIGSSGALTLRKVSSFDKIFPIGVSENSYDELKINRPSPAPTEMDFTVSLKNSFSHTVPVSGNVPREWNITPAATSGNTNLFFTPNPSVNLSPIPSPVIGHWTGSAWQELAATYSSGTYSVQTSSFSPFGVGTSGGFSTVLPLTFLHIHAFEKKEANIIQWTVAHEKEIKEYRVERRAEMGNFTPLSIAATSVKNSGEKTYEVIDNQPLNLSYYRIRSIDFSGEESLSKTISLSRQTPFSIKSIYPMPFIEGMKIDLTRAIEMPTQIEVLDIFGRIVAAKTVEASSNSNQIDLNLHQLPTGVYFLKITEGEKMSVRQIVKR